ncbi:rCG63629 [Rattus norvegicus]|uniref:RCG63629 n=1 Tax=Rattus norvegicus TaxID=10116 RepID=A6HX19_RAT|nr:rCG63629 [Rattus norvegicus]
MSPHTINPCTLCFFPSPCCLPPHSCCTVLCWSPKPAALPKLHSQSSLRYHRSILLLWTRSGPQVSRETRTSL